jgi:S-adenosylmethionine:tRNA ribosyltransferase-isomerase
MNEPLLRTEDFDYELPAERIAAHPIARRDASRLLALDRATGALRHLRFTDLPGLLRSGDCLVVNDSRVIPARLIGRREGGGRAEILLLSREGNGCWRAMVRPGKKLSVGAVVRVSDRSDESDKSDRSDKSDESDDHVATLRIYQDLGGGRRLVAIESPLDESTLLDRFGRTPLPPYILAARRERGLPADAAADRAAYQTVYADPPGSVAAPTAGLHFTPELLRRIADAGIEIRRVTLHVGAGTFAPVKTDDPRRHAMHAERYCIAEADARAIDAAVADPARRVVAVGTTVTRALETSMRRRGRIVAEETETDLLILPGHKFAAVDALVTNFHLPRSTLLMLVCALAGRERVLGAYREAVARGYRFYSFGDATWIG